jgi:hypothetical protein
MKTLKRKTVWLSVSACFALLAIGWLTLYVLSGVSDAIALNQPVLQGLRKEWLLDGSPENPPIKKYVAQWTDPDRFFVWTNAYTIGGQTFQSLFGMNDPRFEGKGILVVSKDGELIWVASTKPPKLLKPKR